MEGVKYCNGVITRDSLAKLPGRVISSIEKVLRLFIKYILVYTIYTHSCFKVLTETKVVYPIYTKYSSKISII